jgi:hypothetical protein
MLQPVDGQIRLVRLVRLVRLQTDNFHKQTTTFVCLLQTKGKPKFDLLGWQTINSNRRLLFQQTCPSTATVHPATCYSTPRQHAAVHPAKSFSPPSNMLQYTPLHAATVHPTICSLLNATVHPIICYSIFTLLNAIVHPTTCYGTLCYLLQYTPLHATVYSAKCDISPATC